MIKNFLVKHFGKVSFLLAGVVTIMVIWLFLPLRKFNYGAIPYPIIDEFTYVWQAESIKRNGLPMAWTLNSGVYKDQKYNPNSGSIDGFGINKNGKLVDINEFKKDFRPLNGVKEMDYGYGKEQLLFVSPFFDHPPIGGFIYDLSVPKNVKNLEDIKAIDFRKSAIVLAIITSVLLFIFLVLITSNPWIGALGVIIYSTVPTYILATRTAFLENVVSPLALTNLILLFLGIKFIENKKKNIWSNLILFLSGLVGGLAMLAKEPAIGFLIGEIIILIGNKISKKNVFVFLMGAALPILTYIGWGLWLQKDLFLGVFMANAGRGYFGAIKAVTQLEALKFKNFPVDGWWIWGFIALVLVSIKIKDKKIWFLTIPLVSHFLTVLMMGSPNYPWYYLSCIPFLAGCGAILIFRIYEKPDWTSALLFFLIPFSSSYYWGRVALGLDQNIGHYRYIFMIFMALLFLKIKFEKNKLIRFIWLIFLVYLIRRIWIYNEIFFPYLMAHFGNLPVPSLPYF